MRHIIFVAAAALLPAAGFAAVDGLEDVAKVTKRDDGLYDVECTYGGVEEGVTVEALKAGKVCQLATKRNEVSFKKFETKGCTLKSFDYATGITESKADLKGLKIDAKTMFASCKLDLYFNVPAGYQIGLKKAAVAVNLKDYEGDPVGIVFSAGESENGQVADIEVDKQGASSYELEFEGYVFTGCSDGQAPQKIAHEVFLAPSQGAITAGSASFSNITYKDTAIRPCS